MNKLLLVLIPILICIPDTAFAQMERERVQTKDAVEETFWTPSLVGMGTVEQLSEGHLNVTIMHNFGIATVRPLQNFFGLDVGPNVRLGLDYGITPNWSIGIGRSTFEKVVDMRTKVRLLRQSKAQNIPLSMSAKIDLGLTTVENGRPIGDDLNYLISLPVARKFGESFSFQIAPMFSRFNTVNNFQGQADLFALAFGGEYRLSRRLAIISEYSLAFGGEYRLSRRLAIMSEYYLLPGERNPGTKDAFSIGLNIETGGHVFQLYLASSSWHTEQHIIARNTDNFWAGDFRFGFNVNRLFFLGE